jgi:excisionase family DNA binding protein
MTRQEVTPMSQNLYTLHEVAKQTDISETNLRNMVQRHKLNVYRLGRRIYLDDATVKRLQDERA